jgi:tetratricopeptide (TPR) repeat protein
MMIKKQTTIVLMALLMIGFTFQLSAKQKKEEMYLAAITEKNPELKMQKLEEYYENFGKKKKYQSGLLYTNLVETALAVKNYEKCFMYAEKALAFDKLTATERLSVKLGMAYSYIYGKKDMEKAESIADEIIKEAETINSPLIQKSIIAPALRLKIAIFDGGEKSLEKTKKALAASLEAYKVDQSAQSMKFIAFFANRLYSEYNEYDDAFAAYETLSSYSNVSADIPEQLAIWYYNDAQSNKSLEYMQKAYNIEKNSKRAYYIGLILKESDLDSSLNALAESVVLDSDDFASKSKEMLDKLYFEEKAKDLTDDEKDAGLEKIIQDAKTRLGK